MPAVAEGFEHVIVVKNDQEAAVVLKVTCSLQAVVPSALSALYPAAETSRLWFFAGNLKVYLKQSEPQCRLGKSSDQSITVFQALC